ncbi:DUF5071 domain-containing protein [Mucilaginibacter pallidiroseus]|uniref:DUF5071 domain-containing protein n=1 Tax=Mucilaginibacter pallidiroseus TaxID=2599295 RepID=A0A563U378_9SPHI|nr:DUF5071 domain-containing protein [Mucilaginibacter pallidiroseus]TWR25809.1 DUF5071 domain-containing protein [Mucilaginibacter pallidiroseus]
MPHKNYIPKHKSDMGAIRILFTLPIEKVREDVPQLLECIQDLHWDIAHEIINYFAPHINKIARELKYILNTNDSIWAYNAIILVSKSTEKLDPDLFTAIKRIAEHPTTMELEDEVEHLAKIVLANKSLCN